MRIILDTFRNIKGWIRIFIHDSKYFIYSRIFKYAKIQKNKIIFNNFNGKGYGDSPKYIANEIIKQRLPYDLVWIVRNKETNMPPCIRKVRLNSIQAAYEYATAKIIICNSKQRLPFIKKEKQFYIQTWHGSFPLKYIEKEAESSLGKRYVSQSKKDSTITNIIISGSRMFTEIIRNSFWFNGEIYECGLPRDDIYFNTTKKEKDLIKEKFHIPLDHKIAIYAPTFRDDGNTSAYDIDLSNLINTLERKTKSKWTILIRLHPNVSFQDSLFQYNEFIINVTQYPDPQELFLISELLITDYSSVMMDFGIMNKPVFLFILDFEIYKKNRGIRPIFSKLPFPICKSNEELYTSINKFNYNEYTNKLTSFINTYYQNYSDGNASKRVVNRINQVINDN